MAKQFTASIQKSLVTALASINASKVSTGPMVQKAIADDIVSNKFETTAVVVKLFAENAPLELSKLTRYLTAQIAGMSVNKDTKALQHTGDFKLREGKMLAIAWYETPAKSSERKPRESLKTLKRAILTIQKIVADGTGSEADAALLSALRHALADYETATVQVKKAA